MNRTAWGKEKAVFDLELVFFSFPWQKGGARAMFTIIGKKNPKKPQQPKKHHHFYFLSSFNLKLVLKLKKLGIYELKSPYFVWNLQMPCSQVLSAPLQLCSCSGVLPGQSPAAKGHTPFWEASSGAVGHVSSMVTSGQRSMQCHVHGSSSWFEQVLNMIDADPFSYGKIAI